MADPFLLLAFCFGSPRRSSPCPPAGRRLVARASDCRGSQRHRCRSDRASRCNGHRRAPDPARGRAGRLSLEPEALWLFGFGLTPAVFACALGSPSLHGRGGWVFGAALSLLGALGVFGLQNGAALLVAWEAMSLGGAIMILSEAARSVTRATILFMLALLEVGAVALVLAVAILGLGSPSLDFSGFIDAGAALTPPMQVGVGILILVGFGAKLGLLPFYEWFPGAYGSGSGASGAILSGVVLNAAFFGLSRGLIEWLPPAPEGAIPLLAIIVVVVGTVSAILTILYAFQEDDWRQLLSFSSAENASIAVAALGAAMLFRSYGLHGSGGARVDGRASAPRPATPSPRDRCS